MNNGVKKFKWQTCDFRKESLVLKCTSFAKGKMWNVWFHFDNARLENGDLEIVRLCLEIKVKKKFNLDWLLGGHLPNLRQVNLWKLV